VAEDDQSKGRHRHIWWRVVIGLVACMAPPIIFHRPILWATVRHFAIRCATKENLKMDFRLEGNAFSYLTVRNLRVTPEAAGVQTMSSTCAVSQSAEPVTRSVLRK
jgi:hypothetical protein